MTVDEFLSGYGKIADVHKKFNPVPEEEPGLGGGMSATEIRQFAKNLKEQQDKHGRH